MVSKALLQKGEEDEEDASKNPHLSKGEHFDIRNYFFLFRKISSHLNCCDGISHWYPGSVKDQSLNIGLELNVCSSLL